jgi:hypothetical protein
VGGANGAGERSEGGIDGYQADEGGSKRIGGRKIRLRAKGGVERNRSFARLNFCSTPWLFLKERRM